MEMELAAGDFVAYSQFHYEKNTQFKPFLLLQLVVCFELMVL